VNWMASRRTQLWIHPRAFRRVGQVLMVDAPWVFGPAWEVIRPAMRKYAALVRAQSSATCVNRGGWGCIWDGEMKDTEHMECSI
jgi:hypothetical protein